MPDRGNNIEEPQGNKTSIDDSFFTDIKIGIPKQVFKERIMKYCSNDTSQIYLFGYKFSYNDCIQKGRLESLRLENSYILKTPSKPKRIHRDYIYLALLDSIEVVLGNADEYVNYLFSITKDKESCSIANWYLNDKTISVGNEMSDFYWSDKDTLFIPCTLYIVIKKSNIESPRFHKISHGDRFLLKSFPLLQKEMIYHLNKENDFD